MNLVLKSSVSIAALAVFLASPASAADVYHSSKDSPSSVLDAPVQNNGWTMFYAGVGVDWLHNRGVIDASPYFTLDGLSADGLEGSVISGFQRQMGLFVAGVEVRAALSEAKFEITSGGDSISLETDFSYAGYGKFGVVVGNGGSLLSALAGYKCQHVQSGGLAEGAYDETLCGLSGGAVFETKLSDHVILGADIIYTRLEDVDIGEGAKIETDQVAAGLRITYGF